MVFLIEGVFSKCFKIFQEYFKNISSVYQENLKRLRFSSDITLKCSNELKFILSNE